MKSLLMPQVFQAVMDGVRNSTLSCLPPDKENPSQVNRFIPLFVSCVCLMLMCLMCMSYVHYCLMCIIFSSVCITVDYACWYTCKVDNAY